MKIPYLALLRLSAKTRTYLKNRFYGRTTVLAVLFG